ncbi:MAG TPA: PCP reductase family protein [Thermoanaerobaculia bacterium]|nr:PCP reductase family protein [Thermoanaerobaculia bacterium]
MKFLCIPCDQQMRLRSVTGPDRGSVSLVYACESCGYGIAMLTNAHETQVVGSLGVQIGPGGEAVAGASKCPVTGMLRELDARADTAPAPTTALPTASAPAPSDDLLWSREASQRLEAIPDLVRPMARESIERFAREHGYEQVTEQVLDRARSHFGL